MKETEKTVQKNPVDHPRKYQVHFGVYLPEMRKNYSQKDLENDPEACAYLVEIGSEAVTELIKK